MGYIRARLASFSLSLPLLAVVGFTVGCGDNAPGQTGTGGSGGINTGSGGSAGTGGPTDGGSGGVGGSPTDGGAGGVGGATGGVGGGTGGVGGGTGGVGGKGGVGGGTGGVGGGMGGVGGKGGGTGGFVGTGGIGGSTGGAGGVVGTGGVGGGTGGTGGVTVQIVAPASDAPTFTDPTKHILAANAPVGVLDQDPSTADAQANVVACTNSAGTATLFVGHKGDSSLAQLGGAIATAAATTGDNCPNGLGFVARFSGVTLPNSTENADGTLAAATELQVIVTSAANVTGTSPVDDVWVDTLAPSLALASPAGLCGTFTQSSSTVTEDVAYTADDALVVANVTNNGVTTSYDIPAYVGGVATFSNVAFTEGQNSLVATENDPAGNATVLAACTVTIGTGPVVSFTTPTAGAILCPSTGSAPGCIDDTDASTPGWQGNLTVHVTASGANVVGSVITFTNGATTFPTATTDANGDATLSGATIPEGTQTILATTDNIPGAGVGSGSVAVTVDTLAPNAPTGLLNATIPSTDPLARRKVLMQLSWTAPSDAGGGRVTGYQVRYSKKPFVTQADFDAATKYPYTTQPANPGDPDGIPSVNPLPPIDPLYIENGYYFAVEATDIAGTPSPMLTSASPGTGQTCDCTSGRCCAAHFNTNITYTGTSGLSNEGAGIALDGSGDANGDGLSDLFVGSSNGGRAYLFFGVGGTPSTTASVTFTGPEAGFGRGVAYIGNVDNDSSGREDLAIAATTANQIFIYKGRASWPLTLADTDADYVISADTSYASSSFGTVMSRLGDFNGDGIDDFAVGAPNFGGSPTFKGRVTIILGASAGFTSLALPSPTRAITIDADPALATPFFGTRVLGVGHFYPGSASTLIVSAPGVTSATIPSNNEGHIYAFRGQTGTAGVIDPTTADAVVAGSTKGQRLGAVLANLGAIGGSTTPSVGAGNPNDPNTPGGIGSLIQFSGTTTTGPFASSTAFYMSADSLIGAEVLGGGIPGRDVQFSLVGGPGPDVVVIARNGSDFGIVDGSKIAGLTSPVDARTVSDVIVPYPPGFSALLIGGGTLLPDINGDGFPDIALTNAASNNAGLVQLFW